jgi:hypothetical protein
MNKLGLNSQLRRYGDVHGIPRRAIGKDLSPQRFHSLKIFRPVTLNFDAKHCLYSKPD